MVLNETLVKPNSIRSDKVKLRLRTANLTVIPITNGLAATASDEQTELIELHGPYSAEETNCPSTSLTAMIEMSPVMQLATSFASNGEINKPLVGSVELIDKSSFQDGLDVSAITQVTLEYLSMETKR